MEDNNKLNEEEIDADTNEEEDEKTSDIEKNPVPQIPTKVNKIPSFPNQNRFGKGAFNNGFNNRQRPGRAASRGR
jgi:hypothetical protein